MSLLVQEMIKGLLPEGNKKTTAVYGGGFKPPTQGHFEVVKTALEKNPNIDEFVILIGGKERDGITQSDSLLIWEIYKKYLPINVNIITDSKPPIQGVYSYAKEHPNEDVIFVIGAREGNEADFTDITNRTKSVNNYPNLRVETVVTQGGVSGTAARNAAKISFEKFSPFVPSELSDEETREVYDIVAGSIQEEQDCWDGYKPGKPKTKISPKTGDRVNNCVPIKENASYSNEINVKNEIARLTKHMISKGMNIEPLPKLIFKNGNKENAKQFLGKTAYYDPNNQSIVLYTEGRHPKDIVRSFAHEMIHHIQNLEGRLGNITTTNTQEDDNLDKLEQEANLKGTMTFRNYTDSLNENIFTKSLDQTEKEALKIVDKNWDKFGGKECNNGFCDIFAKNLSKYLPGSKIMSTEDPRNETFGHVWVEYNEKYFDAETPEGVSSWKELPWMKEFYSKVGSYPTDIENINEAIVGDKIECDNCGWSWNIKDGGDDLFICHKCGHDNTPIKENKIKDPFGINAYAMELGKLREEEGKYKVYLDMDGVLADFDQRFRNLSGMGPREFEDKFGKNKFWDFIDEEHKLKFWIGIPVMPGAKELVDYVKPYDYEILSAPSMKKQSRLGKSLWVKNHIGDVFGSKPFINFKQAKEKHLIKPQLSKFDILVDDRADTIDRWNAAGGTGILYTSAGQTISALKKLGL